jgi:hypothetical protein
MLNLALLPWLAVCAGLILWLAVRRRATPAAASEMA